MRSPFLQSAAEKYLFKHDKAFFDRQMRFAITFASIGIVLFPIYAAINLYVGDYYAATLELILTLMMIYSVYDSKRYKRSYPGMCLGTIAAIIILWQNFYSSGFDNTGILWMYVWPLVTFLLGGAKRTIAMNLIFFAGIILIYFLQKIGIFVQHYTDLTVLILLLSLLIFSAITNMIQKNIEGYVINQIKQNLKIKELNKMKDKFIDIVSIQLQNPLSAIKWNSELLVEDCTDDKYRENVLDIYNSSTTVIDRIGDMTHAIDISESEILVTKTEFNIRPILEKTVLNLHKAFPLRKVHIDFSTFGKKILVNSDIEKLPVILNAIIDNAFRYTMDKDQISVYVRKHPSQDRVVLSINDTGIGIFKKEKHRVFDLFYRGSNANKANPYGTGVGLYVAKSYADKLGIKIKLRSSIKTGTDVDVLI